MSQAATFSKVESTKRVSERERIQLLSAIEASTNPTERSKKVDALTHHHDGDGARTLIGLYARAPSNELRRELLFALGKNGHERAVLMLLRVMRDRRAAHTSAMATSALGASDSPLAAAALALELKQIAEHQNPALLRKELPLALVHLEHSDAAACLGEAFATMFHALNEKHPSTAGQEALVLAVGRHVAVEAWPTLSSLLQRVLAATDEHVPPKESFVEALLITAGSIGDASARKLLQQAQSAAKGRLQQDADVASARHGHDLAEAALERLQAHEDIPLSVWLERVRSLQHQQIEIAFASARSLKRYAHLPNFNASVAEAIEGLAPHLRCVFAGVLALPLDPLPLLKAASEGSDQPAHSLNALATLATTAARRDPQFARKLCQELSTEQWLALGACVSLPDLVGELQTLARSTAPQPIRMAAVHALAMQGVISGPGSEVWMDVCLALRRVVQRLRPESGAAINDDQVAVFQRAIRALGELSGSDPAVLQILREILHGETGKDSGTKSSAYLALGQLGSDDAAHIVWQRLEQIQDETDELDKALSTLAWSDYRPRDPSALKRHLDTAAAHSRSSLLRLLSRIKVEGASKVVLQAMVDHAPFVRHLGLVAARDNHSPDVMNELLAVLSGHRGEDQVARSIAIYSIAGSGDTRAQLELLNRLVEQHDYAGLLHASRHLVSEPSDGLGRLVEAVEQAVEKAKGLGENQKQNESPLVALAEWRERLARLQGMAPKQRAGIQSQDIEARRDSDVDPALTQSIDSYPTFAEEVKAALRNAELTYSHPELFHSGVDKSTMVVEYVKAIDLLCQHHVGTQLLDPRMLDARQRKNPLDAMQSRLIQLGLDDDSLDSRAYLRILSCEGFFTPESFPAHKLSLIVRAVMTGRILNDGLRAVDGLRAWAVMLLLFGRDFSAHGANYTPVWQMQRADAALVGRAAQKLASLQDIRNEVAHRRTMLSHEDVALVRTQSIGLVNELVLLLPRD